MKQLSTSDVGRIPEAQAGALDPDSSIIREARLRGYTINMTFTWGDLVAVRQEVERGWSVPEALDRLGY